MFLKADKRNQLTFFRSLELVNLSRCYCTDCGDRNYLFWMNLKVGSVNPDYPKSYKIGVSWPIECRGKTESIESSM